jgi:hypothetical protein
LIHLNAVTLNLMISYLFLTNSYYKFFWERVSKNLASEQKINASLKFPFTFP